MNGRDLALGVVAGLAVAGALRTRGSRNTEVATLSRGLLRLPGQAPIRVKKLGAGAFATAYVTVDRTPPVVYVLTSDDVYDKELLAMAGANDAVAPLISSPSTGRERRRLQRSAPAPASGGHSHGQFRSEDGR